MADKKISQLTELTSLTDNDLILVSHDDAGNILSKKSKIETLKTYMQDGLTLITDHSELTGVGTNTHEQIDTDLERLADTSGTNTGDQDLSNYLQNGSNVSSLVNDTGYITDTALAPYVKIDASNLPFTGDVTASKSNPKIIATDTGLNSSTWLERMTTNDGVQLVSQNRVYIPGNGVYQNRNFTTTAFSLGDFTISCWLKLNQAEYYLFWNNGIIHSTFIGPAANNTRLSVWNFGNGASPRYDDYGNPADGNWHHFVFVRSGSNFTFYYDNVNKGTVAVGNTTFTLANFLGHLNLQNYIYADEIIIWNSAKDAAFVSGLYNNNQPLQLSNYTGVYAAYHLNSISGSTAIDSSGNGRNGTFFATPTWTTGKVQTTQSALSNVPVLRVGNNSVDNSYGDMTCGYYSGSYGTTNIHDGLTHTFRTLGTSRLTISSSGVAIPTITGSTSTASISATGAITATTSISAGTTLTAGTGTYTGAGLVGTPSHSFSSDTDTGMYSGGSNILKFSTAGTERASIIADGKMAIGAITPTALLDINSDTIRLRTAKTPASATAAGNAGDICWDANYIYICVATNTWKRTALTTW